MSTEETIQTEVVAPSESEVKARAQGWVPKEEFRGNEAAWVSAEDFVIRGEQINPILRKNNERIQKELDTTKKQMEELRAATEEFKQFQKEAFDRKLDKYKEELADLRELKKKAITEGDGELVVEIDDKIDAVKDAKASAEAKNVADAKKKEEPKAQTDSPETLAWVDKNSWYKTDTMMQRATNAIAEGIRAMNPTIQGEAFFIELDKQLEESFTPEKLGRKTQTRNPLAGTKSGTSGNAGSKSDKGYDSLPPEAKAACDKFVKQKILTREQYVADFYS